MSQLQRSVVKARVSGVSPDLDPTHLHRNDLRESVADEESDMLEELPLQGSADEDSSSASSASSASSTGTIRPSPSKHLFARPRGFVLISTITIITSCHPYQYFLTYLLFFFKIAQKL